MTSPDVDLLTLFARLQATGIPCLIVGSIAASTFGEPRSTLDIDILIEAKPGDEDRFYVPPVEVLRNAAGPRQPRDIQHRRR